MRTTINLEDQLLKEAKAVAARSGQNLNRLVEDALRESLSRRRALPERRKLVLTTFKGTGSGHAL